MKTHFSVTFCPTFPSHLIVVGYLLMLIGLLILLTNLIVGLALAGIGSFLSFARNGIEFNPTERLYKSYTSYSGLKMGQWKSYKSYPHLAILRRTIARSRTSRMGVSREVGRDIYYDIFLLDKSHRAKLLVSRQNNPEEAKRKARLLTEHLKVEYVAYNPQLSARTRGVRR